MKTIVFGGSGFVGSHIADALSDAGHDVTIYDTRESPWIRPGQRWVQGDLLDEDAVLKAVRGKEVVYNFAGLADIDEARSRPVETVRTNIQGNVNVLEAARQVGIQRYVFASTIYVYSESGSFYRVSKQACELYIEEYQREHGIDYSILRYGTLYGPRANDNNSVHRYLRQALEERRIVGYGTGEEIREYIHVQDAARLSVKILEPEFRNQAVILTGHHPMRFGDLLKMIREIVGPDVKIDLKPPGTHSTAKGAAAHYTLTPYTYRPKVGRKLTSNYYMDMGQGLIDVLEELHRGRSPPPPSKPAALKVRPRKV